MTGPPRLTDRDEGMNTSIERTVAGTLRARQLAEATWQLSSGADGGPALILAGAEAAAGDVLKGLSAAKAVVSWQRGGVLVTLFTASGPRSVRARTAILHEPLARVYDGLPLVAFDERARRFWRRVFLLVRIPGGRRLLRLVARRSARRK